MSDELVCPNCGREEHLRGERVGERTIYLCEECDREELVGFVRSGKPLPPPENPAADVR